MSAEEFAEWRAYYRLEPWGETRADLRSAQVALWVSALAGAKGKRLTDFLPSGMVPAVEAWEAQREAPKATDAASEAEQRKAAAAVLKAALAGVRVVPAAGKPAGKPVKPKAR